MRQQAFTIIEVLMALGLLTMSVSIIAGLQFRSLVRIVRDRDDIEKIFLIKKELYSQLQKPLDEHAKKRIVTKLENPEIAFTTHIEKIHLKSSLAHLKDRLLTMQTRAQWKLDNDTRDSLMAAFVLRPQQDKQKEQQ